MSDEFRLVLVGRTGHGKSSTGNSILGEKIFPPRGVTSNVKDPVQVENGQVQGQALRVVDGSNIGEADDEYPDNAKELITLSDQAIGFCMMSISAIVLLLKYGVRFTKQERDAVSVIKSLFGSDVIQRHGVIVMTGGDQFARDAQDDGPNFQQWCNQQAGDVQKLMEECDHRIVLFNNKTKDKDILQKQREQLLTMVKKVLVQSGPYIEGDWERAEPGRRKLVVMTEMPQMEEETDDFIDEIRKKIDVLRQSEAADPSGNLKKITQFMGQLQQFEDRLKERDQGTRSVTSLIERLGIPRSTLQTMYNRLEMTVFPPDPSNAQSRRRGPETRTVQVDSMSGPNRQRGPDEGDEGNRFYRIYQCIRLCFRRNGWNIRCLLKCLAAGTVIATITYTVYYYSSPARFNKI